MTARPEVPTTPKRPVRLLARARRTRIKPELMHLVPQGRRRPDTPGLSRHGLIHTLNEAGQVVQIPGRYWVKSVDHVSTGGDYVFHYEGNAIAVEMKRRKGRAFIFAYGGNHFVFECSLEDADEMAIGYVCGRLPDQKPVAGIWADPALKARIRKWIDDQEDWV